MGISSRDLALCALLVVSATLIVFEVDVQTKGWARWTGLVTYWVTALTILCRADTRVRVR